MSSRPDPEQIDRDELAAGRLERDRQREPHRHPRCVRPARELAGRNAFMVGLTEADNNRSKEWTIQLRCPACGGPVFVATDSSGEVVTCNFATCGAELTTRRTIDGVDVVLPEPVDPDGAA